jgi:hypothetical protein
VNAFRGLMYGLLAELLAIALGAFFGAVLYYALGGR